MTRRIRNSLLAAAVLTPFFGGAALANQWSSVDTNLLGHPQQLDLGNRSVIIGAPAGPSGQMGVEGSAQPASGPNSAPTDQDHDRG